MAEVMRVYDFRNGRESIVYRGRRVAVELLSRFRPNDVRDEAEALEVCLYASNLSIDPP